MATMQAVERSEARQRLIEAALLVFGDNGFKGASTRAIAAQAGANIAAIPYYFGGKEGLYLAVAEHIVEQMTERMGSGFAAAESLADDPATGREARLQALLTLGDRFVVMMVGSEEAVHWARFIVREQFDPTEAFDLVYDGVMGPAYTVLAKLMGPLLGLAADSDELKLRVFSMIGQVLIFRVARTAVLRRLGWESYTPARLDQIRAVVRAHLLPRRARET